MGRDALASQPFSVVSYAANSALTYAGGSAIGLPVVTSDFKISYVRPGVGERLIDRAHAVHTGKTQSVCRCEVFVLTNGEEKLCAVAQDAIASLPDKGNV